MPLSPQRVVDTRSLFRPISTALVSLLRELPAKSWQNPTVAGSWLVRDVVAHMADGALRRVSGSRDGLTLPPPPDPIRAEREFASYINALNAEGVAVYHRYSTRVLTDVYEQASTALADYFESAPLEGKGTYGVSWAGEESSDAWFDIAREFSEVWHHQAQVRLAIDAPPLDDPRYLQAVLAVAVRALPHAYRHFPVKEGTTISVAIPGASGGLWTLERDENSRWTLWEGSDGHATTRITIEPDVAWRLFFHNIPEKEAPEAIGVEGRLDLARPLLRARSVVV
jgi:uncharacterized protein (TIGR03083 family)